MESRKVLLFEADLRRPRFHRVLGLPADRGLSTFLQGEPDLKSMASNALHENLWVVPSGPIPSNPSELLCSPRMERVVRELLDKFDFVMIDSSPVLPVADAISLSSLVEGVILVVDASRTSRQLVKAAHDRLAQVHARILGVVLNQVRPDEGYYYRHYRHYYREYTGTH